MTRTAKLMSAVAICIASAPAVAASHDAGHQHSKVAPTSRAAMTEYDAKAKPSSENVVHVPVIGADGKNLGMVMLQDTPAGVLVTTDLKGLPAGEHGFHFHEKGLCDVGQKFTTAGSHFAAGNSQHGLMTAGGHHGGDMPNAHVGADGMLKMELLNTKVTLAPGPKSLADADGSALVIHARADDYKSQPAGDAGDRIACAVVAAPKS